jgi:hypothetical protein
VPARLHQNQSLMKPRGGRVLGVGCWVLG